MEMMEGQQALARFACKCCGGTHLEGVRIEQGGGEREVASIGVEELIGGFSPAPDRGEYYRTLAESGDPAGQLAFALYCLHGYPPRHVGDGLAWMQRAALGGVEGARLFLARFYSARLPGDDEVVAAWAARILAEMFENGWGVPKTADAARRWWEMSAHWAEVLPDDGADADAVKPGRSRESAHPSST
jgi:hypothetical protein